MRLLFEQNRSFKLCQDIADLFPGSDHVRTLGLSEADDRAIWNYAETHSFTVVSQDADFADMAMLLGPPPKVIWLRAGNQPRANITALLRQHAELILAFEAGDAVCLEIY
jgi:predicted nuclease of predicted toxin-antitoxin system